MGRLIPLSDVVCCRRCGRVRLKAPTNRSFCRSCWKVMTARFNLAVGPVKRSLINKHRARGFHPGPVACRLRDPACPT